MDQAVAYSTLAVTVGLAVSRPRLGELRVSPGVAAVFGVCVLSIAGLLTPGDLVEAARIQWRPLLALTCIMVMTGVVKEVGAFERLARRIERQARSASTARAFDLIFLAALIVPSLLNNDAAILLLTPVVIALARRLHPTQPRVVEAFAFAVFLAPGVAPFVISNPMNMIVAELGGIGFNAYARVMAPLSLAGALVTFSILRFHYRDVLALPLRADTSEIPAPHRAERAALGLLVAVFLAYPILATCGAPIWPVALAGAIGSLCLARVHRLKRVTSQVSPDILVFLWGVFLVVAAVRKVGIVDHLARFYSAHSPGVVGVTAALGSALVDNHPMALVNLMALHGQPQRSLLAALVGGDIGPRLLPIGSLAGLLWMDLLRRRGVEIPIGKFVRVGTLVLIPTLAISLLLL